MSSVAMGSLFPKELINDMFSKVVGKSSIAKLANQMPIAFNGNEIMTFSLDSDISIVAEGAAKPAGDATVGSITITPLKVVYQARINDEFKNCAEDKQLDYLEQFADGFAKKIARGLDIMVFHGLNPATSTTATAIGTKCLDLHADVSTASSTASTKEQLLSAAIGSLGDGYTCNGIAMSPAFASALAATTVTDEGRPYKDFMWGGNPGTIRGINCDVNPTVAVSASTATTNDAYVGDFQNCLKWGYAANIPMELIEYGDPDGQGDLKKLNQILLRTEAYIGWGILDGAAFGRIFTSNA